MTFVYPKLSEASHAFNAYVNRVLNENDGIAEIFTRTGVKFAEETDSHYRREHASCYWKDGDLRYSPKTEARFAPTDDERKAIEAELPSIAATLPKPEPLYSSGNLHNPYNKPPLPAEFEAVRKKAVHTNAPHLWSEFHQRNSEAIDFIEARFEGEKGKYYRKIAWVDGDWCVDYEPEERPLFGLETLKPDTPAVWVFEGSKACLAAKNMAKDHPWFAYVHASEDAFLAVGGALATTSIDLNPINRSDVKIYLVADRDDPGREAMGSIARHLRNAGNVWRFDFDDRFRLAWDLADPLPATFFEGGQYVGPPISDFKRIGCWMTRQAGSVVLGNGHVKPVYCLSAQAAASLAWIASEDRYYFMDALDSPVDDKALDGLFRGQGSGRLSEAVLETESAKYHAIDYLPGVSRSVMIEGKRILNVYQPTRIEARQGDVTPFLDFIARLVPDETEAREVKRWLATVIGKPERKISYALLMASEMHGTGKTTLGEKILMPLVGLHNASTPGAQIIEDKFTGWLARKKLIVVNEIYEGSNWKLSNKLKSLITDDFVMERRMGVDVVPLRNSAAFYASSNSSQPVALEDADRRWLVPSLTNNVWTREQASEFYSWLRTDGLSIILYWARNQSVDFYIQTGEHAPSTSRKTDMIFDSKSEEEKKIEELFKNMEPDDIFMSNVICRQLKANNPKAIWLKDGKIKAMGARLGLISLGDLYKDQADKGRLHVPKIGKGYALAKKAPIRSDNTLLSWDNVLKERKETILSPFKDTDGERL